MKRLWEKPKLVVIVRGRPEEAVLGFCKKGEYNPNLSPQINWKGCFKKISEGDCSPTCEGAPDS